MRSLLVGLALLMVPVAASAVTFSDGTFAPADWTTTVLTLNGLGGSAAQVLTGGNPGAHRTSFHRNGIRIMVIGMRAGAIVDPSKLGGIASIDYSEDSKCASADGCVGGGQGRYPALLQNGKFYINQAAGVTGVLNSWTAFSATGLVATDFDEVFLTGPSQIIAGSHPDFSALGSPVQLGLARANSNSGERTGRIDNWSVTVTGAVTPRLDIASAYNDAFPANENPGLPGTFAFDTTTAHIKIGLNIAQTTGNLQRYNVPGDSLIFVATGDSARADLVFRILPGVGNYSTVGDASSGLVDYGTGFWAAYQSTPGEFAGIGGGINPSAAVAAHAAAPSGWSPLVWNSARMDSAESFGQATFPVQAIAIAHTPGGQVWAGTYHESDGKYATLGIAKNRCFVIDTTNASYTDPNTHCGATAKGVYPPAWVSTIPSSRTGWDGTTTTGEGTKIIPDGLLTAGAHVQYFLRSQQFEDPLSVFAMVPDTTTVSPQNKEGPNTDGHRWQQFGVLPDRWKDAAFGGAGMACMLFYDNADRRGNERVWKGVADSIGATLAAEIGNADGYGGVPADGSVNDAQYFIANKNQQMGTTWDAYQMKGSESGIAGAQSIGGRLGYRAPGFLMDDGAGNGKWTYNPPTLDMLYAYYKMMLVVTGDLSSDIWGPYNDRTGDDIATFEGWLLQGSTTGPDRGILVIGESFVEAAVAQGNPQLSFVSYFLATLLVAPDYRLLTADMRPWVDVKTGSPYPTGDVYGVSNSSLRSNDVVNVNAVVANASVDLEYVTPTGALLPAGVIKRYDVIGPYISQTITVDIAAMGGRFGSSYGRLAWMYNTFTGVFANVCQVAGNPIVTLDTPQAPTGTPFVNFLNLRNNPLRSGHATIHFGLAAGDRVQIKMFDVGGRLVRTLADRKFKAGEHTILWDGVDDIGRTLPRGVYFAQLKLVVSDVEMAEKLVIIR